MNKYVMIISPSASIYDITLHILFWALEKFYKDWTHMD